MAYDIFFRGEALPEKTLDSVKQHFAQLFKANPAKLDMLFSGKVVALKKQLSKEEALKYQQLFKKAGAKIYIKPSAASNETPDTPKPSSETTRKPSANLHTLPLGSDVLTNAERSQQQASPTKVNTSNINLAPPSPLPSPDKPVINAPDTSHLSASLSEQPLQQTQTETREVDTSALTLAEPGSKMLDYYDDIPSPLPKLDHLSLDAPGSLLSEPKAISSKAPDTSHLQIKPNS